MEQPRSQGLVVCEPHSNQHDELSQTTHPPGQSLGAGIPTHLGTPASSETGSGAIHPRGPEISIVTCHGAGPAPVAVANEPLLLWSILWSAYGGESTVFLYTLLLYRDSGSMSGPIICCPHSPRVPRPRGPSSHELNPNA